MADDDGVVPVNTRKEAYELLMQGELSEHKSRIIAAHFGITLCDVCHLRPVGVGLRCPECEDAGL